MSLLPPYRAGARRPRRSAAYRPSVDGGGGAAAARRWGRPGSHRPGHALAGHDRPPPQGDEEIPRCPTAPPLAAAAARACPSPPPRPPSLSSQAVAADPAAFAAASASASAWGVELLLGAWSMAEETARFPFTPPITLAINLPFLIAPGLSPSNLNQGRPVGRFLRCPLRAVGRRRRRGQSAHAARVQRFLDLRRPRCSQVRALLLDKQRAFGRRLMPWLLVEVVAAAVVAVVVVGRIGQLRSGQVK